MNTFEDREKIKQLRESNNLTYKDLANDLDVNDLAIFNLENDELLGRITTKQLRQVGEAMGYKLEYGFVKMTDIEIEAKARAKHTQYLSSGIKHNKL